MSAKDLHRPPKGTRTPGSGRVKGTPNRVSVEARQLASQLVNDPIYQWKLRVDFKRRRVHPTIESLIWQYCIGKPVLPVAIQGSVALDVNARLEDERKLFAALDLAELEQLAAESQALVDRAAALAKVRTQGAAGESPDLLKVCSESLDITSGSDNESSVNQNPPDFIDETEGD